MTYYNRTNTCDRCKISFEKATGHPYREYNKEGNWTGKWDCRSCWRKYDPNSDHNVMKSLADRRTGNQNPNSSDVKGDRFQLLTCRWRSTVSTVPVEDLNKKLNNYHSPIDHSLDSELGIPQTRGKLYDSYNRRWLFGSFGREWNKKFDHEICYCASKDGKIIERLYIFPIEEIKDKRTSIGIVKNPINNIPWYEKYRVIDEKILKKVNDIWKEIVKGE